MFSIGKQSANLLCVCAWMYVCKREKETECKTDIEEYTQANLTDLKQWMLELPLLLKNWHWLIDSVWPGQILQFFSIDYTQKLELMTQWPQPVTHVPTP